MLSAGLMFAETVRAVSTEARRLGIEAPAFRAPPADPTADRSIRRRDGQAIVSVRLAGRPILDVQGDIIEGVLAANRMTADKPRLIEARRALWAALHAAGLTDTRD